MLSDFARQVLFQEASYCGYMATYVGCSMVKFVNEAGDEIIIKNEGLPFQDDFLPGAWEKFVAMAKEKMAFKDKLALEC